MAKINYKIVKTRLISPIPRSPKDFRLASPPDAKYTWEKSLGSYEKNNKMILSFLIPEDEPPRRVVIIICGFGEGFGSSTFLYYRIIGKFLAEHGAALVLLPLPFHLDRAVKSSLPPGERIYRCPPRFYLAYEQIIAEVFKLKSLIKNRRLIVLDDNDTDLEIGFISDYLAEPIEFHLSGYSMGGMATSAYYLLDTIYGDGLDFAGYHILASGFNFSNIEGFLEQTFDSHETKVKDEVNDLKNKIIGINIKQWAKIKKYYKEYWNWLKFATKDTVAHFSDKNLYDVFHKLMLDTENEEIVSAVEKNRRIVFSIGGKDSLLNSGNDPTMKEWDKQVKSIFGSNADASLMEGVGHLLIKWPNFRKKKDLFLNQLFDMEMMPPGSPGKTPRDFSENGIDVVRG